jgi:hypothetical protein
MKTISATEVNQIETQPLHEGCNGYYESLNTMIKNGRLQCLVVVYNSIDYD